MRSELRYSILDELSGSTTDIVATAILSTDSLIMASMLNGDMEEARVGAMSAAMHSLIARICNELIRGANGNSY